MAQPADSQPADSRQARRAISASAVIHLYRNQSLGCRVYLGLRRILLPLAAIERHIPLRGRVLDAGCGFGLLANFVAMRSPGRSVRGIDLAPGRIAVARAVSHELPNVRFDVADLRTLEEESLDAIMLIDMLHYFPEATQAAIVEAFGRALVPGGVLVCRASVRERGPRFWWNWLHEAAMVRFGLTTTSGGSLHFASRERLRDMIAASGFDVIAIERERRLLPYTDTILVARAIGRGATSHD